MCKHTGARGSAATHTSRSRTPARFPGVSSVPVAARIRLCSFHDLSHMKEGPTAPDFTSIFKPLGLRSFEITQNEPAYPVNAAESISDGGEWGGKRTHFCESCHSANCSVRHLIAVLERQIDVLRKINEFARFPDDTQLASPPVQVAACASLPRSLRRTQAPGARLQPAPTARRLLHRPTRGVPAA